MTLAQIDDILTGSFMCEADRTYWITKRAELIEKEGRSRETQEYFRKMQKYSR